MVHFAPAWGEADDSRFAENQEWRFAANRKQNIGCRACGREVANIADKFYRIAMRAASMVASHARNLAALVAVILVIGAGAAYVAHRVDVQSQRMAAFDTLQILDSQIRSAEATMIPSSAPLGAEVADTSSIASARVAYQAAATAWANGDYDTMLAHEEAGFRALNVPALGLGSSAFAIPATFLASHGAKWTAIALTAAAALLIGWCASQDLRRFRISFQATEPRASPQAAMRELGQLVGEEPGDFDVLASSVHPLGTQWVGVAILGH